MRMLTISSNQEALDLPLYLIEKYENRPEIITFLDLGTKILTEEVVFILKHQRN